MDGSRRATRGLQVLLALLAVVAVAALLPVNAIADEQFILHPGYVQGTVSIPDPEWPGGAHTIQRLCVSASGQDPVTKNSYSASTYVYNNNQFTLVVEGGNWPYTVYVTAHYDGTCQRRVRWQRRTVVPAGWTVPLTFQTDAFIEGTISIEGESVTQIQPSVSSGASNVDSPQYGFWGTALFQDGNYRLPVVGGNAMYWVYSGNVRLTDPNDYMNFSSPRQTTVPAGGTAVVDYSVTPGYIEGRVTVSGANLIPPSYGSVAARFYDQTLREWFYASTKLSPDGTYRFPMFPGQNITVYASIYTDKGNQNLIQKSVALLAPGETAYCDWEVVLDAGLGGEIAVTGINLDGVYIYGYGPNGAYRAATIYSPAADYGAVYDWDNLTPGLWGIYVYVWDYEYDALYGIQDYDYYFFRKAQVELVSGQQANLDFTIDPGFIGGSILAGNSASIAELRQARVQAYATDYGYPTYSYESAWTQQYDNNLADDHNINLYDMFVGPGDWWAYYLELWFRHRFPDLGYDSNSYLYITERNPTTGAYNVPVLTVDPGETGKFDFGYQTGRIIPRLWVATGLPLSSPSVSGSYLKNVDGVRDKSVSISGSSSVSNVLEGLVYLHAVPGTYRLTASAYVQGTTTTFGQPFEVTVGPGDVVKTDPDAPTLVIGFPPGYYETTEDCVVVSGTVTDESGVESLTINGTAVTVNPDGSYQLEVCGLQMGENVIELVASDIYANTITIQRIVIRVNQPPIVVIGGPYAALEGSAITFDASGSSDPEGQPLQFRWDLDGDGTWDTAYSTSAVASHTWEDDYGGTVVVEVSDGENLVTGSTTVTVSNAAPVISSIEMPAGPVARGAPVNLSGNFTDAGILDTHTATIDWGDGATSDGAISESGGSGTVTGSHAYSTSGAHAVTLTVQDDNGGSVSATTSIVVNSPPVAEAGPDRQVECPGPEGAQVTLDGSGSTDPDSSPGTNDDIVSFAWYEGGVLVATGETPQVRLPLGSHILTLTVTDSDGLSSSDQVTVTVQDTTPPALSLPANQVLEATSPQGAVATFSATASDLVDGAVEVTCTPASGSTFPLGTTPVQCSATDSHGNPATASFTVTVQDTTPPVIVITSPTSGAEYPFGSDITFSFSATDVACVPTVSGSVDGQVVSSGQVRSDLAVGEHTLTVTATDASGNTATQSVTFSVVNTVGRITVAGWIELANKKGTAGFTAQQEQGAPAPTGNVHYMDHDTGMKVDAIVLTGLGVQGNHAWLAGLCTIDGVAGHSFLMHVVDGGQGGDSDHFYISLDTGYSAGDTLGGGNVTIEQ